jgi:PleD family two-component response regulator
MMDLITLPTALSRPTVLHAPDERLSAENKENPRILIVEDDYVVGVELENALADAGFVVVGIANSAQEAVHWQFPSVQCSPSWT